jgi:hypothetical protein
VGGGLVGDAGRVLVGGGTVGETTVRVGVTVCAGVALKAGVPVGPTVGVNVAVAMRVPVAVSDSVALGGTVSVGGGVVSKGVGLDATAPVAEAGSGVRLAGAVGDLEAVAVSRTGFSFTVVATGVCSALTTVARRSEASLGASSCKTSATRS